MSAPEKIWAWCFQPSENGNWGDWGGYARQNNMHALDDRERATGAEYIRADLTPPAADYVADIDKIIDDINDLLAEAEVSFPAGRDAGASVSISHEQDEQLRAILVKALAARPASPDTRVVTVEQLEKWLGMMAWAERAEGNGMAGNYADEIRAIIDGGQDRG